jgi:hypothetical protein
VEAEYQCASNFNHDVVQIALNFAKESKKELRKSTSLGTFSGI